ncbi:MAG: AAA family ATPase [Acidimicrobiia bacterium]
MTSRCGRCGEENRAGAKFCQECGAPLTPVEGERRRATVLFVDAVDSTPLAERLGEEEMYSLMQGCLDRMTDAVHHYDGHVASFTGDGIMAVFGAPVAQEESERRAVAAALRMQRALAEQAELIRDRHGVDCRFRIGLNTGPVVVGKVSDALTMESTAIGDTVNLAARVQGLAGPGEVYLTEATYRVVADHFECEALGRQMVKGKDEPIALYRALRERSLRTRFQVAAERGLAPFVGRGGELGLLVAELEPVRHGGGRVALVSGDAGLGKSRLVAEFHRPAAQAGVTWLEGHCIPYGRHIPYLPLIEIVKGAFGVEEADDDAMIIDRVSAATAGWDANAAASVPYLRFLLSVDPGDPKVASMDPRERRAGLVDALGVLLAQLSRTAPTVVVVEDLHWADESTQQALLGMVPMVNAGAVLLLLTARPSFALPDGYRATRLDLVPLGNIESAGLVRGVLRAEPPAGLERLVADKAEGNPFYIEEVIRSLLETGILTRTNGRFHLERTIDEIRIPGTIQEVILARVDRLARPAKAALQLASVIGREFTVRLLERISEQRAGLTDVLGELQALDLIYEDVDFPELAYMFKHALTHEVAYSTLLAERRRSLHRIVAAAIEELYADRLTEQCETLAHHYFQADEVEKAVEYLSQAGDKAAASFANQDALDAYARALELCDRLRPAARSTAATLASRRGFVYFFIGRYSDAIVDMEQWLGLARELGDRQEEGSALVYRGLSELFDHDKETAEATLREVLDFAQGTGFEPTRVLANLQLAHIYISWDRHDEAEEPLRYVEEHLDDLQDPFARGFWGWYSSRLSLWSGRLDEALQKAAEGRAAAHGSFFNRLVGAWNEGHALATKGDYEEALQLLEEAVSASRRIGFQILEVRCLNTVGYVYAEIGDLERAMRWNGECLEATLAAGAPVPEAEMNARLNLVENFLTLGRLDDAAEQLAVVEPIVRHPRPRQDFMRWRYGQRFLHDHGEYWLARKDPGKAAALAEECRAWAERTGSRKNIGKARHLLGRAHLAEGRLADADGELRAALGLASEVGNPPQIWKTWLSVAHLRDAQGRADDAREAFGHAADVIEQMAARLSDPQRREIFLTSGPVQAALRHSP